MPMRSTHATGRYWDGSPITRRPRRTLNVDCDSPSLLRIAQRSRCRDCGNLIDWHTTSSYRPVSLHPDEVPAVLVPADLQWHLASGVAYPAGDGSRWCRLSHITLCPASTEPCTLPPTLQDVRRRLALNTRRHTDTKTLTPRHSSAAPPSHEESCVPGRPVVRILYGLYITSLPVQEIQCVAQTGHLTRCTDPVLAHGATPGRWALMQASPHRRPHRQVGHSLSGFAVYDLSHLSYSEQKRWRAQRCPAHAATPGALGLEFADWEPFDPSLHHPYLVNRLPQDIRPCS
ncbi:DUF6083 domain-containing protein [Streptomyces sp. NPDC046332]|uniref:DUF6083 domain-containing protein n=1 Tax=Streptomyces sp. NPDC046332 TaxID=3155133 RepID=UPI0033DC2E3F